MIIVKCIEKVRDKNNIITDYVLEDCNGVRQTLSSAKVKNMIKCRQLNILNLKLTSNGKLIDKQGYRTNTVDTELPDMGVHKHKIIEDIRHKRSWDENYETLCRAINNGVKITRRTVCENINIGVWINTQRYLFKIGELSEDKIQKLKDIGLEFGVYRTWDENYEALCRAINNGVEIDSKTVYEDINIGHWVTKQRYLLKNGKLSEDKAQKIKDIGLELDPRKASWDENYEILCRAINNGVKINSKTVYEDINIGIWLYNQHQLLKSGKMPEDKIQKLKDIGLEFDTRKIVPWDESYETLCRAIENKVKINQRTVYEGINIGKWINNQRKLFKNGKLPEDRIEKLRKIGVII